MLMLTFLTSHTISEKPWKVGEGGGGGGGGAVDPF